MAAEYSANVAQTVLANQPVIFTESPVPCRKGIVFHRDGSGSFLVASRVPSYMRNCGCVYETQYLVTLSGNIAIPTGGTPGSIQLALAVDGEVDPSSIMIATPAAVEEYESVSTSVIVSVPSLCGCNSVSVRNISDQSILTQNMNILFEPVGVQLANRV